jgi:transcriptional regulator GlxA family with amidase domain
VPDHALPQAPQADWLIVPGGVMSALLGDRALLSEMARRGHSAEVVASVCTGALVLAAAGLLHHAPATTHWEDLAELAARHPDLHVLSGVRWVDNGRVVTSAGIAAGIDMSLHLVARHGGAALAERTARQMDTPWHPEP